MEPVSWLAESGTARSRWRQDPVGLGTLRHRVGAHGITAVPGALLPQMLGRARLDRPLTVEVTRGEVDIDAVLVRPLLSTASFSGERPVTLLYAVAGDQSRRVDGASRVQVFDRAGREVWHAQVADGVTVRIPSGGLAVVVAR